MDQLIKPLLWFQVLGCGILAGLYFAFSAFIMTALERAGQVAGVAAMNAINRVIVRSLFMPLFFGTPIAAVALAILLPTVTSTAAAVIYVLGMFGVTMFFNVPLNNALMAAQGGDAEASEWARFLKIWTSWNHVRTVACIVATALYVWELNVLELTAR
jgi:uncharacterized membrane protein